MLPCLLSLPLSKVKTLNPLSATHPKMSTIFKHIHRLTQQPNTKQSILIYLTKTLNFPLTRATTFYNKYSTPNTNPQHVITYLKTQNFSFPIIQKWVNQSPQILFTDVENTLKPKLIFFKELGLVDQELTSFISKNPTYLSDRFEKRLVPCLDIVKRLMGFQGNGK